MKKYLSKLVLGIIPLAFVLLSSCHRDNQHQYWAKNELPDTLYYSFYASTFPDSILSELTTKVAPGASFRMRRNMPADWGQYAQQFDIDYHTYGSDAPSDFNLLTFYYKGVRYLEVRQSGKSLLNRDSYALSTASECLPANANRRLLKKYEGSEIQFFSFAFDEDYLRSLTVIPEGADLAEVVAHVLAE